jgi:hypothetical protein
MKQYIDKAKVVAEIERIISNGQTKLKESEECKDYESYVALAERIATCINILSFINTLEVNELDMPALDNGIMPVERWKEACEAASCQANYRKSKGLTETCDDYFVDGVQWADEHPIKAKEVGLEKEIERFVKSDEFQKASGTIKVTNLLARHFFELGLKAQKGG